MFKRVVFILFITIFSANAKYSDIVEFNGIAINRTLIIYMKQYGTSVIVYYQIYRSKIGKIILRNMCVEDVMTEITRNK